MLYEDYASHSSDFTWWNLSIFVYENFHKFRNQNIFVGDSSEKILNKNNEKLRNLPLFVLTIVAARDNTSSADSITNVSKKRRKTFFNCTKPSYISK